MTTSIAPKILTYRLHEFRPSDRKELKRVLESDGGQEVFVSALMLYLGKWAKADWLTEYDLERIAQWTAIHFPRVAQEVENMSARECTAAQSEQAKKTYAVMARASSEALQASKIPAE